MPRIRSRVVETESVNQRMLRRGAVKRQHIDRWAVGDQQIAPGVVGDTHLHPTAIERIREVAGEIGHGELLVLSATGASFASGGAYVTADSIVYQHGFDRVTAVGDPIIWPRDAVGEVQVEFAWDTYRGGGTIEIEVDGVVPAWGTIASGTSGGEGCKRRSAHIRRGAVVTVKVTQTSGTVQTGDVLVEFVIPDPSGAQPGQLIVGLSTIGLTYQNLSGLCWDGTNFWITNDVFPNSVTEDVAVKITDEGEVVAALHNASVNNPKGICFDGTNLWIVDNAGTVFRCSPSTLATVSSFPVAGMPFGITFDGTNLWVSYGTGEIRNYSTAGVLLTTTTVTGAPTLNDVAWDGTNLWVIDVTNNQVSRIDTSTGAVLESVALTSPEPEGLEWRDGKLWVLDEVDQTIYPVEV